MAQTIAAQRGVTTVNGNGTTATTLFTQSTGTATRVILNNVSVRHEPGAMSRVALCIDVNGTGNYACVAIRAKSADGNDSYGINMMPGSSLYPTTSITSNPNSYVDRWVPYVTNANVYFGSTLVNNRWNFSGPNGSVQGGSNVPLEYIPSQFWMNSGDSLVLLHFNTNTYTANVVYSFTTITES